MDFVTHTIQNFLNLHWIRPEVALWRTMDVINLKNVPFSNPMIDLGCGDGTFSFTNFNGKLELGFDVFTTIKNTTGFFEGKDIQNQKTSIKPIILKKPKKSFDVGLDWKKSLLYKASDLGTHKKLIKHNLNEPLPVETESFETVFSNVFYWIPKIKNLLKESNRITTSSGKIVILVPDKKLKENLIFNQYINHKYNWAKILDRGIYKNITKHAYSFNDWKKLFSNAGLKIEDHSQYLSPKLVKLWSIGMRPYSPFMIEMANKIEENDRKKIKKRVIKEITPILRSFVDYEISSPSRNGCFHLFVLKK